LTAHIISLADEAVADILEQAEWYESQADYKLAERWENAVTSTLLRILAMPRSGRLCHFKSGALAGIRRMAVDDFPKHLVFYRFRGKELFVLRIVHGARDLDRLF